MGPTIMILGVSVWIGLSLLIAGAWMLTSGRWRSYRGQTRYCRRCSYNLTGLSSDRCPECGAALSARTIRVGERVDRLGVTAFMIGCGAVGLAFLVHAGINVDWYRVRPFPWVMNDLQSKRLGVAPRAWRELVLRDHENRLSHTNRTALVELCLDVQGGIAKRATEEEMLAYMQTCCIDGSLTDAQRARFFQQAMPKPTLEVRPRIVAGDPLVYHVSVQRLRGIDTNAFTVRCEPTPLLIDGRRTGHKLVNKVLHVESITYFPGPPQC